MKIKNTVNVVESEIDDEVLRQVKALKAWHPDKKAVIQECLKEIKEKFPEIEIFEVGPDYIVTEKSMYFALFEDEMTPTK